MSTFLLIIKILPWVLSLGAGVYGYFVKKRMKWFSDKVTEKQNTIDTLQIEIEGQQEEIAKRDSIIDEMLTIQIKFEKKKGKITGARSATEIMQGLKK